MLTTIIVGIICFLSGAVVVFARFVQQMEKARRSDPFQTPPTIEVQNFVMAAQAHLTTWAGCNWKRAPVSSVANVQNMRQALDALAIHSERSAIWTVEHGVVTLPDGTQLPIKVMARALDEALKSRVNLRDLIKTAT